MPYTSSSLSALAKCCKSAPVISYYDNCGAYCLAQGQSVDDLTQCLYGQHVAWQDVFCSGNKTSTATGSAGVPTSAQASVVSGTAQKAGVSATGSAASQPSKGAAAERIGELGGGKAGLGVAVVLLTSIVFGMVL